ncbi:Maf family protein [Marinivivus vitaminiproducens]|uniref:Maf family protein n=1 Tax=Marinivivus vitaminiproducens TaxID=3035935 RepID=UPI0027A29DCE|nr:Maf family protein [Geminicoccaceae bacterium SCSIO 64248]
MNHAPQRLPNASPVRVVLASASAARARLLADAGVALTTIPAAVDEAEVKAAMRGEDVAAIEAATILAEVKATRVATQAGPEAIVIGADQILVCQGRWFDKPEDMSEARAHLQELRGRDHTLATSVVACRGGARVWHAVASPRLWMRPFSDAFLDAYLATAGTDVLQSVGAYHIEGLGAQLFGRIEGDPFAIQGLPLLPLLAFLRDQGVLDD